MTVSKLKILSCKPKESRWQFFPPKKEPQGMSIYHNNLKMLHITKLCVLCVYEKEIFLCFSLKIQDKYTHSVFQILLVLLIRVFDNFNRLHHIQRIKYVSLRISNIDIGA